MLIIINSHPCVAGGMVKVVGLLMHVCVLVSMQSHAFSLAMDIFELATEVLCLFLMLLIVSHLWMTKSYLGFMKVSKAL